MIEIYYVEDDPDIARAVKVYLENKGLRVTVCAALSEAEQALRTHVPTCVLLDWNMPDGQGDSLCRWIRRTWKELPVIFLTVRGDTADIVSGFQNGADDYVVKPFELEVLYSRILALLRRTGDAAKQYLSCGGIVIDRERRTVSCHWDKTSGDCPPESSDQGEEVSLSVSEYELLLYLMENKGRTVTREKILEHVWDVHGSFVNDNTLTVTMKRLRDKLRQPRGLKTVRSVGYRMEEGL